MKKNKIKPNAYLFPMPLAVIGANVKGKPNFEPLAYVGIVEYKPPLISIASYETHYTNIGITENRTFSVNTPSEELIEEIDYCGIESGQDIDKSDIFECFYGELKTAPMILKSPLNLECEVVKSFKVKEFIDLNESHEIFIGRIVNAYADERYLTGNVPDLAKLNTFTYSMGQYWSIGEKIAKAWTVGQKYKKL
ncbi:MAG: flavin reductase family protein [Candidatus Thorarchaeota archaeon]